MNANQIAPFAPNSEPFVIGKNLRGHSATVWTHPSINTQTGQPRSSLEQAEGQQAYADGIDGYAAQPYPELSQQMTDWFAGWLQARNADRATQEVAA